MCYLCSKHVITLIISTVKRRVLIFSNFFYFARGQAGGRQDAPALMRRGRVAAGIPSARWLLVGAPPPMRPRLRKLGVFDLCPSGEVQIPLRQCSGMAGMLAPPTSPAYARGYLQQPFPPASNRLARRAQKMQPIESGVRRSIQRHGLDLNIGSRRGRREHSAGVKGTVRGPFYAPPGALKERARVCPDTCHRRRRADEETTREEITRDVVSGANTRAP